ncbi:MAG TPA: sugar ABC transporter ATP-binding protein [Thermomicrobiales bacterium]|nr:sugar ABC transporter ATP-binding protein [Thermomicrobiales bacterium]
MTELPPTRLRLSGITKSYGGIQAVRGISLDVRRGEILALCGENGAGKSTLAKILAGEVRPDAGMIELDGQAVRLLDPASAHREGIAVIYQELNYVPTLTVAENVLLGRLPRRGPMVDWDSVYRDARLLLAPLAPHLDPRLPVAALPVAERQVVEIARALSLDASVIVMDEPTAALSQQEVRRLFDLVRHLAKRGVAIIYISHRLDEVFALANRVAVLRDGALIGVRDVNETSRAEVIRAMVGRSVEELYPRRESTPGQPWLEVRGLSRGGKITEVSFSVCSGEVVGIFGLIGSGADVLVKALFGATRADHGEVIVGGRSLGLPTPGRARRAGIALVPADRKEEGLVLGMSVRENLSMSTLPNLSKWGFIRRRAERIRAEAMVRELRIRTPGLEEAVGRLSGGNQQKVVLGRWLQAQPRAFVLEEPTRGIDVGAKVEVYRLIENLAEGGAAILLVSSELPEILSMSDRILTICDGHLTAEFRRGAVTQEEVLDSAIGRATA